ncbi:DUF1488 family protein [Methylobacterium sp. A49B]|uniref:DUF1488 domain-containing protein n=1 Tax=Methylobacterium mesophilicum SR1.6/6 TaxID=908290 RepID=A0A6B9FQW9_9HYPH|nr:DUF1488 family protein [Methylobacterium mesophilicum]MBE7199821.1 DUF1488 family protein [Parafilimonas terrae]QGY03438.1 DUF1488 domain-containing protein [Methylobacterium mesophilicum SR1.6/6]
MPLAGYEAGQPVIDQETLAHVRFGMLDGRVVPCRVPIDVLRDLFHAGDRPFDPLDIFRSHRRAIEDAAIEKYERSGAPDGILDLDESDFI